MSVTGHIVSYCGPRVSEGATGTVSGTFVVSKTASGEGRFHRAARVPDTARLPNRALPADEQARGMGKPRPSAKVGGKAGTVTRRDTRGAGNSHAKLALWEVMSIRRRFAGGEATQAGLAREYGVDRSTIHLIVKGKRW